MFKSIQVKQNLLTQRTTRVEDHESQPCWDLQDQGKRKGAEEKVYLLNKGELLGAHIPLD
jgi:plasmid replication initiation protein